MTISNPLYWSQLDPSNFTSKIEREEEREREREREGGGREKENKTIDLKDQQKEKKAIMDRPVCFSGL